MSTSHNKTVPLDLTSINGNAFVLIGAFRRQAKREGWADDDIQAVCDDCMSGNYDHLLQVLIGVTRAPNDGDEENDL